MIYLLIFISIFILFKPIVFFIFYPQMALDAYRRKHNNDLGRSFVVIIKMLTATYVLSEVHFFRNGLKRYLIFQIGSIPSLHIRKWLYKGLGADISNNVVIHFKTEMRCPENLKLGEGTIIGDNAILDARRGLNIGRNVNLSSNVSIYTLQHDHRDPNFKCSITKKMEVTIEDRVWLGSNVIVLPGVHIGEGAVCCAGCVVTKDIEPYAVVAGIPAKKVSVRPRVLKYNFDGRSCRIY